MLQKTLAAVCFLWMRCIDRAFQGTDRILFHANIEEALLVRAMRPNKIVMLTGGQRLDNRGEVEDFGYSDIEDSEGADFDSYLVADALETSVSVNFIFFSLSLHSIFTCTAFRAQCKFTLPVHFCLVGGGY